MSRSVIYRNVRIYRFVMGVLYKGRYRERFKRVCELIRESDGTVLELCFGDVAIAEYCREHGKRWTGLDVSDAFVAYAARRRFDARKADVARLDALPACDVCVMMGSLYHFKERLPELFRRIKNASPRFVLSEPVRNWTHANVPFRFLARALTRTDEREETFRFDEASLVQTLDELKATAGFEYRVASVARDMVVEVVWSN
jgi:trans-aconitate methyltransferase